MFVLDPISVKVFLVFGIFLVLLGIVGNITSIIVLSRRALRRLKIRTYLRALAVFDLICSCLLVLEVLRIGQERYKTPLKDMQCKLMIYFAFFVSDCSSWIAVAITIERLLYVVHPFMVRHQRGTAIALSLVMGLVAIINIPIAMHFTAEEGKCVSPPLYTTLHSAMLSWIPATIMILSNIIITYTLCRRPKLGSNASTQRNNSIRIAIAVNLIFLCTTFPVSIVWAVLKTLYLPLYLLLFANYALNFVSYIIAAQIFRDELKALLCAKPVCCRKSDSYSSSSYNAAETAPPATSESATSV